MLLENAARAIRLMFKVMHFEPPPLEDIVGVLDASGIGDALHDKAAAEAKLAAVREYCEHPRRDDPLDRQKILALLEAPPEATPAIFGEAPREGGE